ncbi:MAG TPA: aminotransferase class V-fold PLP-dependent enzyme [Planctomycetota bacterium]|nr:aminotransferase class V-fold PLP-dependent enzyme [Planctomycetota bacterium]
MNRRQFLEAMTLPAIPASIGPNLESEWSRPEALARIFEGFARLDGGDPVADARNEDLWREVQLAFTGDRTKINLNNGGCCPSPRVVQEAMQRLLEFSNDLPTHNLWQILEPQREPLRQRIARQWACDPEEIAFTRNTSESLQTLQFGMKLERGDEVVTTTQDYPRMLTAFEQRERRDGIVLKKIQIPVPCEDDAEVVRRFEAAVTPRTRMILVCHAINLTGQLLPVKAIVAMGRKRGIPVLIDGAHTFAHLDFTFPDLDCDYFGTSLHKWLFAPHGTGLLYVRKSKIDSIWPLFAAPPLLDKDIRKFEEIGTHPAANTLAIGEALSFHQGITPRRKQERLYYLREVWTSRLAKQSRVHFNTSLDRRYSIGIANVRVEGIDTGKLQAHLWAQHRIWTTGIDHPEFNGLRITPSVQTTLEELDRFCEAIEKVIEKGLPA